MKKWIKKLLDIDKIERIITFEIQDTVTDYETGLAICRYNSIMREEITERLCQCCIIPNKEKDKKTIYFVKGKEPNWDRVVIDEKGNKKYYKDNVEVKNRS